MPRTHSGMSSRRSNCLAICISVLGVGVLYSSFDPVPAGENTSTRTVSTLAESFSKLQLPPLPPESQAISTLDTEDSAGHSSSDTTVENTAPTAVQACLLNDQEAIEFSMLLLQDGARFLKNIDTYTAQFHKEERINGDMTEMQSVDIKVQHSPHFAVYMKWRNGDKGRQVLYSNEYEDGNMVVKLGGLKGRLLPAIKLNPLGSQAMAESRHPITEAGILGMLDKIIEYRQQDLKHGHGVRCMRLPNQEFDQRDCYCFVFEYESPEFSSEYRKSELLIDTRYHIPLMARNYTWATDAEDLSASELDELTMIENYSFSQIDFSKELVAIEFSRDNPKYRM